MARTVTLKVMGKERQYQKQGDEYYRVKPDGNLAKSPEKNPVILRNIKNKTSPLKVAAGPTPRPKNINTVTGMGGSTDVRKPKPQPKVNQKGPKARPKTVDDQGTTPRQRSNSSKIQKLAMDAAKFPGRNKPRDTSIKGLEDLKAMPKDKPTAKKPSAKRSTTTPQSKKTGTSPNARALKAIQERNAKAKNPLSKGMLGKIEKELKKGGKPVYKDGMVVGVTHKGLIGTVYTGRPDSNPFKRKKKKD
tara:strand:+ start:52 stop:792 length:741 start_codon:yes stop_codon:yes gene_type:complete